MSHTNHASHGVKSLRSTVPVPEIFMFRTDFQHFDIKGLVSCLNISTILLVKWTPSAAELSSPWSHEKLDEQNLPNSSDIAHEAQRIPLTSVGSWQQNQDGRSGHTNRLIGWDCNMDRQTDCWRYQGLHSKSEVNGVTQQWIILTCIRIKKGIGTLNKIINSKASSLLQI